MLRVLLLANDVPNSCTSSLRSFLCMGDVHFILIPRDQVPFRQHQESRSLGGSNFQSMHRVIISYSQPIIFVRVDPEHAQSDRKSVNLDAVIGQELTFFMLNRSQP